MFSPHQLRIGGKGRERKKEEKVNLNTWFWYSYSKFYPKEKGERGGREREGRKKNCNNNHTQTNKAGEREKKHSLMSAIIGRMRLGILTQVLRY